jgi:hypothetical protein
MRHENILSVLGQGRHWTLQDWVSACRLIDELQLRIALDQTAHRRG